MTCDTHHLDVDWDFHCDGPALYGHSASAFGDEVVVVGGCSADGRFSTHTWVYGVKTKVWLKARNMGSSDVASRFKHCATVAGGKLFVHGGFGVMRTLHGDMWCYTPARNTWDMVPPRGDAPGPRADHASVLYQGVIYLYGGWTASGMRNDLYTFDPDTHIFRCVSTTQAQYETVSACFPSPSHRRGCALVAHKNVVHVLGGRAVGSAAEDNWGSVLKGWHTVRKEWVSKPTAGPGWAVARRAGLNEYTRVLLTHWPVVCDGSEESDDETPPSSPPRPFSVAEGWRGAFAAAAAHRPSPGPQPQSPRGRRRSTARRVSVADSLGLVASPKRQGGRTSIVEAIRSAQPHPPPSPPPAAARMRRTSTFPAPRAPAVHSRSSFRRRSGADGAAATTAHPEHPWAVVVGCGVVLLLQLETFEMHTFTSNVPQFAHLCAAAAVCPTTPHVALLHGGKAVAGGSVQSAMWAMDLHAPCFLEAFVPHAPGMCAVNRSTVLTTALVALCGCMPAAVVAATRRERRERPVASALRKRGEGCEMALSEEWTANVDLDDMDGVYRYAKAQLEELARTQGLALDPQLYHHAVSIHTSRARFNYSYTGFTDAKTTAAKGGAVCSTGGQAATTVHAADGTGPATPKAAGAVMLPKAMDFVFREVTQRAAPAEEAARSSQRIHPRELMDAQRVDPFAAVSKEARRAQAVKQAAKDAQQSSRSTWRDIETTEDLIAWFNYRRGVVERTPFRPPPEDRHYLHVSGFRECVSFPDTSDPSVSRVTNQVLGMPWRYAYRSNDIPHTTR